MDTNKQIAKALLNKSFSEAKEFVFKSLYAKASLALDEARFAVANSVFNEAKKTTGVPAGASEDKFAAAREEIKKAGHKAKLGKGVPAGRVQEEAELDEQSNEDKLKAIEVRRKGVGPLARLVLDRAAEKTKKDMNKGKSGVKEEVEQIDEVSPPGMEKMTGSKKTKASFAKQYGKRGKSVMYATAWKLHNKKAND